MVKSVVIFQSNLFDLSEKDSTLEEKTNPLGKDLAEYLKSKLNERDITASEVIEDELGWVLDLKIQDIRGSIYIHWAPIKGKSENNWVIQINAKKSLFSGFKKKEDDILNTIKNLLDSVLSKVEGINDLLWVDMVEFSKIY